MSNSSPRLTVLRFIYDALCFFLQFAVRNRVLDLLKVRIFRGRETTDSTAGGKKNGQNTEFREFREIQEIREIQENQEIREIPGFAGGIHREKIDIVWGSPAPFCAKSALITV